MKGRALTASRVRSRSKKVRFPSAPHRDCGALKTQRKSGAFAPPFCEHPRRSLFPGKLIPVGLDESLDLVGMIENLLPFLGIQACGPPAPMEHAHRTLFADLDRDLGV